MMRGIGKRTLVLFVFILSFLLLPIAAAELLWTWDSCADSSHIGYRYQLDGEDPDGWVEVDSNTTEVRTTSDYGSCIYVQATSDGISWLDLAYAKYMPEDEPPSNWGIRIKANPYTVCVVDFIHGHDVPEARFLTVTDYGFTLGTELFWKPFRNIAFNIDAAYSMALKGETVIPDATDMHLVRIGGGVDLVLPFSKASFLIGINGGELISINGNSWNPGSYMGLRLLVDFNLDERISLGIESGAALSYQSGSELLLRSQTWLIDQISMTFTYRF